NRVTVVVSTPTYALRLAEVAQENGIVLGNQTPGYAVRAVIVGGEPRGGIPATRRRIEESWHARLFDQSGMTEIGPATCECLEAPGGLHLLEGDFIAEVIDPRTPTLPSPCQGEGRVGVPAGEVGELVLTNLGRLGSPLLRYRTGDLVRVHPRPCPCGCPWMRLDGGILGRTDDMLALRGNNVYPSALENVIRRFAEVVEYRITIDRSRALAEMRLEIEPAANATPTLATRIGDAIRDELMFRAEVALVAPGTLPRFEMKARRIQIV